MNEFNRHRLSLLYPGLILIAWCIMTGFGTRALAQNGPLVAYSHEADVLVLSYTQSHDMIAENDPTPLLRIYGNGRVLVHFPNYMKRAGDYEMTLTPQGMQALMSSLATKGVMDFNAETAQSLRQHNEASLQSQTGTLTHVSDTSQTVIEVHLTQYTSATTSTSTPNLHQKVSWANLQGEARRHRAVSAIQELAAAERELQALLVDSNLKKIK